MPAARTPGAGTRFQRAGESGNAGRRKERRPPRTIRQAAYVRPVLRLVAYLSNVMVFVSTKLARESVPLACILYRYTPLAMILFVISTSFPRRYKK